MLAPGYFLIAPPGLVLSTLGSRFIPILSMARLRPIAISGFKARQEYQSHFECAHETSPTLSPGVSHHYISRQSAVVSTSDIFL
jgi:hypothetical protein